MATLFPPGLRLFDADGAPLSGAKVRVLVANSETLVTLYSDAALSSTISNPVVTDAAGYPANGGNECAIYCAAGTYDVAFLDANDVLLASWDDVSPAGESGDLERTLTGNGRIKITGSAGAVLIQVGDPSPDNTGGTLTIEGQAGTQGDLITLDFATANTTGRLKENSKALDGVVHTAATTFNATEVAIPIPEIVNGARLVSIDVFDLLISTTTGNLRATISYDGGGSYKTGASDYHSYVKYGTTETAAAATAFMDLAVAAAFETASGKLARVLIDILTVESGTNPTIVSGRLDGWNNGATSPTNVMFTSYALGGYGRATHIKIYDSAGGTLSGSYRTVCRYGYGE